MAHRYTFQGSRQEAVTPAVGPAGFVEIVKEEVRSRIDWMELGHGSGMVEVLSSVIVACVFFSPPTQ